MKLPFVIKIFVLSIFEWPRKTGYTVLHTLMNSVETKISECGSHTKQTNPWYNENTEKTRTCNDRHLKVVRWI